MIILYFNITVSYIEVSKYLRFLSPQIGDCGYNENLKVIKPNIKPNI